MSNAGQPIAHAVDRLEVLFVRADDRRSRMADDVGEIVVGEAIVDGDEDGSDLRHRVERLELGVGVWRDVGHSIAAPDTESLQGSRPAVAPVEQLLVAGPPRTVDDRLATTVEGPRPARELERSEGDFHNEISDFRFQISDLFQICRLQLQISMSAFQGCIPDAKKNLQSESRLANLPSTIYNLKLNSI